MDRDSGVRLHAPALVAASAVAASNAASPALTTLEHLLMQIERYAWFTLSTDGWLGPGNSLMDIQTGRLTALGQLYVSYETPAAEGSNSSVARQGKHSEGANTWTELCRPCLVHLEAGKRLAALPPRVQHYCSRSCGFWPNAQAQA